MGPSSGEGCSCRFHCVKEDAGMCICPGDQICSCQTGLKFCICLRKGKLCTSKCSHKCQSPLYDCGNITNRRREVERKGEVCYWLPDLSFDASDGTCACSFDPPSFGVKTDVKERSSKKRRRTEVIPTFKAFYPLSSFLDDPYKGADVYDDQRTNPYFGAAASQTNYDDHQFDLTGTDEDFSDISNEDSVSYSFDFFAGERSSAALYTIRGAKLDPLPRLEPESMIQMFQSNHLKTNDLATYFYDLERSIGQYTPCIIEKGWAYDRNPQDIKSYGKAGR